MNRAVHVINLEIKDNHEEALIAGKAMLELCSAVSLIPARLLPILLRFGTDGPLSPLASQIENATNVDDEIDGIIQRQMQKHPHEILHTVGYY